AESGPRSGPRVAGNGPVTPVDQPIRRAEAMMSVSRQHDHRMGDGVGHPGTAFVLGGGGLLGAHEVGMLRALTEAGVLPNLGVGTSVGAFNGAFVAADPQAAADLLAKAWQGGGAGSVFAGSFFARVSTLVRSGTHLHSANSLATALDTFVPGDMIEDLMVP